MHKSARLKDDSRRATVCSQGISVDFAFKVQHSKDSPRYQRLKGLNGETCYCLNTDHLSGHVYGRCFRSKSPPVDFLRWLATHGLGKDIPDKYIRLDLGGELGRCQQVLDLFHVHGYKVEPTAANPSAQLGIGERPHRTIVDGIRALLGGALLESKFWPYASGISSGSTMSPSMVNARCRLMIVCAGKQLNLSFLRNFGCRVFAKPQTDRRPAKAEFETCTGIYLG
jgi:hypothetical protein